MFDGKSYFFHTTVTDKGYFQWSLNELRFINGSSVPFFFFFQAIPVALSGRDIIGIAKTGSGKTAAFLWPALVHIMDQPELEPGDGPIALICAPTRELCQQIFAEARRFGKVYNIHAVAVFGGGNKYEQSKALQEGAEIVVATPVRKLCMV